MATSIKREYTGLRGVDFSNDSSLVNISRSPDALNVWKNYSDSQSNCIETRPGYSELINLNNKINGIHFYNNQLIIHAGTDLYIWSNFPSIPAETQLLKSNMNNVRSSFVIFNDKLYIVDGLNYLVYDGELNDVKNTSPYIPTTSISRNPSGGGELYQDVNLLQPLRKNTFLADGTSTDYYLDAQFIDEVTEVKVNDVIVTNYSVNKAQGKISFAEAPQSPKLSNDNVEITFKKEVQGYIDRIGKCTKVVAFDNRLFFTGNPEFKNAIFHSELETPNYISDLAYYQDGTSESEIKSLVVGNNRLWVFKELNQENETIFYHTATVDSTGKVYPNYRGNVSTGCYADAINYKDDIVFLSREGLEGISSNDIYSKQLLNHRSSLVDNKLINENNYSMAMMTEWKGYLVILVDNRIYLADMRQTYTGTTGYEYEWYYWKLENQNPSFIKEYKGNLYFGTENGSIFIFKGTNDNGNVIISYWTTPMDNFGYGNMNKTTNKRGGIAKIKTIPNGEIKISEITNKRSEEKYITKYSTTGFSFVDLDFSNFTFTTQNNSYIIYKIKEKKFVELGLRFYSDELDKPFGLYSAIIEAFVGGYVKK